MAIMLDKTIKTRWLSANSYDVKWGERSGELLSMFLDHESKEERWTFSEYGCGPYTPFRKIASTQYGYHVDCYDLKKWSDENEVVDLNEDAISVTKNSVGVLSGVCEYMNDLGKTLALLSEFHQYFLLSYGPVPLSSEFHDAKYLKEIRIRSTSRGWRNHMNMKDLVGVVSAVGYIADIRSWDRQVLLYIRGFNTNL